MDKKRILVACGTGGVTSKNIAMKIEKFLKSKNIDCVIDTCKVVEVRTKTAVLKPDLVASSTQLPDIEVPKVVATALLTGIGVDKVFNEIYEILTK